MFTIPNLLRRCLMLLPLFSLLTLNANAQTQEENLRQLDSLTTALSHTPDTKHGEVLRQIFLLQYALGQIDSCMNTLDHLIDYYAKRGNEDEESKARWNKVAILNNSAMHEELLEEAEVQKEWFREHGVWDRYYQAWHRKMTAQRGMNKMHTAMREAEVMLEDAKQRNNAIGRAMALKTLATSYNDIHQYDQAKEALNKAIQLLRDADDYTGMRSGLYDQYCQALGMQHEYEEELNVSNEWLRHLFELSQHKDVGSLEGPYCSAWLAKAHALTGMKRYDEARQAIEESEEYYRRNPIVLARYYILMQRATMANSQGQYQEAIRYTDSIASLHVADTAMYGLQRAEALMHVGRTHEAADIYHAMYVHKDTTFSHEMRAQLDEMTTLYHLDELQMKQSLERTRWLVGIISLVALAVLIIALLRRRTVKQLRQKNEELRVANAKAHESSEMKTQFIHNISHEIRTPLNIVSGFTQVITQPDMNLSEDNLKEIREDIVKNTNRITSLVNKMLELSDANSHTVIECDDMTTPAEVATQAIDASHIRLAENVQFTQDTVNAIMPMKTNTQYAARALTLLLGNAKKFLKKDQPGKVSLSIRTQGDRILFIIEDNGIGVPPAEAEHIFQEFVQLNDYYEGTGIGLTVARSLARRMGGDIILDTTYNNGARFIMTLPLGTTE